MISYNHKYLVYISLIIFPITCEGKAMDFLDQFDSGFLFLAGMSLMVIIGALVSIINLNFTMFQSIQESHGIPQKVIIKESLWKRMNAKLTNIVPIEKESDILLDHNYDGIKELDNSLPPWWLYGFYFTIIFGIFYIGYFHYSDNGMNMEEEYKQEMAFAKIEVAKYLERQANKLDESNLEILTDAESLAQGENIFRNNCLACHMEGGGGSPISVGPNLTDDYWLHGGGIINVFKVIKYGVPDKGMIAWSAQLKPSDMHKVASYIVLLRGTNPPNAKKPEGELYVEE